MRIFSFFPSVSFSFNSQKKRKKQTSKNAYCAYIRGVISTSDVTQYVLSYIERNTKNNLGNNVKVAVLVDGIQVGEAKTITVEVKPSTAEIVGKVTGWGGATVEHLEAMTEPNGNNLGNLITSENFADLYNNDSKIVLHWAKDSKGNGWSDKGIKEKIKTRLTNLGGAVVSALSTAGLDKSKLQTAANTVVDRYISAGTHYKKENSGKTPAKCFEYMEDNRVTTKSRIVNMRDTDRKDSNIYMIHFKDFVDDVLAEYNKLI